MMSKTKITGIILAGGKSRRMGVEKGLLRFGGKYMIEYGLSVLNELCDEILISENSQAYHFLGYQVIPDVVPNSGPMGGIYSALKASSNEINIVLSCDMPFVNFKMLNHLLNELSSFDVAVPWYEKNYFEPMCAVYHKNVIPTFEKFIQDKNYRIPDAFKVLNTHKVLMNDELEVYHPSVFENINSKKELEKAHRLLDDFLPKMDRLLLVAGSGRNVGKTSLACRLIEQTKRKAKIVGVKISPHIHDENEGSELIFSNDFYSIYKETELNTTKDSSRMLRAGASKVYYIHSKDHKVYEAFERVLNEIEDEAIICESGGLRNFVIPSAFIICNLTDQVIEKEKTIDLMYKPHLLLQFKHDQFDVDVNTISFDGKQWVSTE